MWLTSGSGGARGVKCWGRNASGELGDGTTIDRRTPVDVSGLAGGAAGVAAGGDHTCALVSGGDGSYGVKCWGNNSYGQLGDGTTANRYTPVDVIGLTRDVTAVTLGVSHTCALTEDGGVKCWGENSDGELGDGTAANRHTPVDVSGLGSGVLVVAAGAYHTCAVTSEGAVKCWGSNHFGQLGDGTTTGRPAPVAVSGLSSGVVAVACGLAHTCALTSAGAVKCWGANWHGQLGVNPGWAPVDVVGFEGGTFSNRLYLPLVHLAG